MAYLISDMRKLLRKNWLFQAVVLVMLVIMIADPISAYFMNAPYIDGAFGYEPQCVSVLVLSQHVGLGHNDI